jgi:hypothetical protein
MRNIVDDVGEIIAKTTDDDTLIGGHHRLANSFPTRLPKIVGSSRARLRISAEP